MNKKVLAQWEQMGATSAGKCWQMDAYGGTVLGGPAEWAGAA